MSENFWKKPTSRSASDQPSLDINNPEIKSLIQSIKEGASRKGGDPVDVMLKTFLNANFNKYIEAEATKMSAMVHIALLDGNKRLEPTVENMTEAFLSSLTYYSGLAIIAGTLRCTPHMSDEKTCEYLVDLCDRSISNLEQIRKFAKGPLIEMLKDKHMITQENFAKKWKDVVGMAVDVSPVRFQHNRKVGN